MTTCARTGMTTFSRGLSFNHPRSSSAFCSLKKARFHGRSKHGRACKIALVFTQLLGTMHLLSLCNSF
jgi:hypothetical protein